MRGKHLALAVFLLNDLKWEHPMKSHTEYLTLNIPSKMAFQNITPKVEAAVKKSGVQEGIVLTSAMHITASVFINDDERGLHHDFGKWLEQLAPCHRAE